uniref:pectate lyase n=1 Tax=Ditylenchus dipsaci TaxID=166011 RepID=A0A915DED9_9BILA
MLFLIKKIIGLVHNYPAFSYATFQQTIKNDFQLLPFLHFHCSSFGHCLAMQNSVEAVGKCKHGNKAVGVGWGMDALTLQHVINFAVHSTLATLVVAASARLPVPMWEDVGTHAGGFGTDRKVWSNPKNAYRIEGGGALNAEQKVFVQQGAGTTYVNNFYASNMLSLWVFCGNCEPAFKLTPR